MSQQNQRRHAPALLLSALLLTGCHGALAQNRTYPVSGTVTFRGEPASCVMLRLVPTAPNKGVEARAITNQDGSFELRTYSNDDPDGASPGEYQVILEEYDPVSAVGAQIPASAKPTRIPGGGLETGKIVKITGEEPNLDIDIPSEKPAPGAVPLPDYGR
jgi:hypothetical protein